jgi:hypothetical protein
MRSTKETFLVEQISRYIDKSWCTHQMSRTRDRNFTADSAPAVMQTEIRLASSIDAKHDQIQLAFLPKSRITLILEPARWYQGRTIWRCTSFLLWTKVRVSSNLCQEELPKLTNSCLNVGKVGCWLRRYARVFFVNELT